MNLSVIRHLGMAGLVCAVSSAYAIEPLTDDELQSKRIDSGVVIEGSEAVAEDTDTTRASHGTQSASGKTDTLDHSIEYELYRNQQQPSNRLTTQSVVEVVVKPVSQQQLGVEFLNTTPLQTQFIQDNADLVNQGLQPFNIQINPSIIKQSQTTMPATGTPYFD